MKLSSFALLFVVFLDVIGQGLALPIFNSLLLDPSQDFLPKDTTTGRRELAFGVVMAVFYLSWFLGAAYISKLTDVIGRKEGMLICLGGAVAGYVLTIVALALDSFALVLVARMISGFTAGNQPIAQAALVDISENEDEKTRNMSRIVVALSLGLIAGPLMGGLLSDKAFLGDFATLSLPFYAALVLVFLNIILIVFFYDNPPFKRQPFKFQPAEVFLSLWHAGKRPLVLKLSVVFFCSQLALNSVFVFLDTYLFSRFHFDTFQNSLALVIFGGTLGLASATLVVPLTARFRKKPIILGTLAVMALSVIAMTVNGSSLLAYVLIVPLVVAFAINYPVMLTLFSASVDSSEQGWIMGVSIALFTLGTGLISLLGGRFMASDIHLPFMVSIGAAALAAILVTLLWSKEDMARLDPR